MEVIFSRFCERRRKNAGLRGPPDYLLRGGGCRWFPVRVVQFLENMSVLVERGQKNARGMLAFLFASMKFKKTGEIMHPSRIPARFW